MTQGERTGRTALGPGWCFCPTPSHLPRGEDERERCGFPCSFKAFFFVFTVAEASQVSARRLVGTIPQLRGRITPKNEPPCWQALQPFLPASFCVPLGACRKFWKASSLGIGHGIPLPLPPEMPSPPLSAPSISCPRVGLSDKTQDTQLNSKFRKPTNNVLV